MKSIFLLGGMTLFSGIVSSQELKVSNQRTAVADPNQKQVIVSENNTEGTLVIRPVERAMHAAVQSDIEKTEGNIPAGASLQVVNQMERTATQSSGTTPEKTVNSTTKKPE